MCIGHTESDFDEQAENSGSWASPWYCRRLKEAEDIKRETILDYCYFLENSNKVAVEQTLELMSSALDEYYQVLADGGLPNLHQEWKMWIETVMGSADSSLSFIEKLRPVAFLVRKRLKFPCPDFYVPQLAEDILAKLRGGNATEVSKEQVVVFTKAFLAELRTGKHMPNEGKSLGWGPAPPLVVLAAVKACGVEVDTATLNTIFLEGLASKSYDSLSHDSKMPIEILKWEIDGRLRPQFAMALCTLMRMIPEVFSAWMKEQGAPSEMALKAKDDVSDLSRMEKVSGYLGLTKRADDMASENVQQSAGGRGAVENVELFLRFRSLFESATGGMSAATFTNCPDVTNDSKGVSISFEGGWTAPYFDDPSTFSEEARLLQGMNLAHQVRLLPEAQRAALKVTTHSMTRWTSKQLASTFATVAENYPTVRSEFNIVMTDKGITVPQRVKFTGSQLTEFHRLAFNQPVPPHVELPHTFSLGYHFYNAKRKAKEGTQVEWKDMGYDLDVVRNLGLDNGRCKTEGCDKRAQKGGYCRGHGRENGLVECYYICKHTNCNKFRQIQGYCKVHAKEVLGEDVLPDSYYCKHTNCNKYRHIKGYCQVHAKEFLGEDVVPDSRKIVSNYCKFSGCCKRCKLKGFCMAHAHKELDKEVVKEYLRKVREKLAKRKRGDDDGDNDS